MPNDLESPKFAQLYFYDTDHELCNRLAHMELNPDVLSVLQLLLETIIFTLPR